MKNLTYIKDNLDKVLFNAANRFKVMQLAIEYDSLSTKLQSELISNMLESAFNDELEHATDPKVDSMPDLIVNDEPLEIKTSKTTRKWRGGEFSKRESDYLLVSYDDSGDELKWFFLYTYLTEDDWKSSTSKNYYATTIDLDYILDNKEYDIIRGDYEKKRILNHLICK